MRFKDLCFYGLIVLRVAAWSGYIVWTLILMVHLLEVWEKKVEHSQRLLVKLRKWLSIQRGKKVQWLIPEKEPFCVWLAGHWFYYEES